MRADEHDARRDADYLRSRGCSIGGVTHGRAAVVLWYDETRHRALPAGARRARPPACIDTNGAGDIFHGAYVYSYLIDPDAEWEQHFRFARAASALFDPASRQRSEPADARRRSTRPRRGSASGGRRRSSSGPSPSAASARPSPRPCAAEAWGRAQASRYKTSRYEASRYKASRYLGNQRSTGRLCVHEPRGISGFRHVSTQTSGRRIFSCVVPVPGRPSSCCTGFPQDASDVAAGGAAAGLGASRWFALICAAMVAAAVPLASGPRTLCQAGHGEGHGGADGDTRLRAAASPGMTAAAAWPTGWRSTTRSGVERLAVARCPGRPRTPGSGPTTKACDGVLAVVAARAARAAPERLVSAAPDAVVDDALGGWGSPGDALDPDVRAAYIDDAARSRPRARDLRGVSGGGDA